MLIFEECFDMLRQYIGQQKLVTQHEFEQPARCALPLLHSKVHFDVNKEQLHFKTISRN